MDKCIKLREQSGKLPPGLPEGSPLHITFVFTEEGMITVRLVEPSHDVTVTARHGGAEMSDEEKRNLEGGAGSDARLMKTARVRELNVSRMECTNPGWCSYARNSRSR